MLIKTFDQIFNYATKVMDKNELLLYYSTQFI